MRYRILGRSGLRVSEVCLGALSFGGTAPAAVADDAGSRAIFDVFAEAGGTFIDTACSYNMGRSEEFLGEVVAADRDHFVIATKYSNGHGVGLSKTGNSRRTMVRTVEGSLKRLKTDYVDLLWLHNWDFTTPIDEVMHGFDDLVSSGKVNYVGISNAPAWEISRANMMADLLGMKPLIAIEIELSLLQRDADNDLLPMARALDLGVLAWSPLAAGALARRPGAPVGGRASRRMTEGSDAVTALVSKIADEVDATPAQVALAALRRLPGYGSVIPIVGASRPEQLKESLAFLELAITNEQVARLDAATAPTLVYPHNLLRSKLGERLTTGGQLGVLDNHRR